MKNKSKKTSKQTLLNSFINLDRPFNEVYSKLSAEQQLKQSRQKLCELSAENLRIHNQMQIHLKRIRRLEGLQPKPIRQSKPFQCSYTTQIDKQEEDKFLFNLAKENYANKKQMYIGMKMSSCENHKTQQQTYEDYGLSLEFTNQNVLSQLRQAKQTRSIPSRFFACYTDGFDIVLEQLSSLGP